MNSDQIYINNLTALRKHFPEVYHQLQHGSAKCSFQAKPIITKQGQVNVVAGLSDGNEIAFYTDEDIIASTEELMAEWKLGVHDILFCVGMGLGYYPLIATKKFREKPHIVIIEPHPAVFQLALTWVDLRPVFEYDRLDLFVGQAVNAADIINKYNFQIFLGNQRIVTHGPSRIILGDSFLKLEHEIKAHIGLVRDLWQTSKKLGKQMMANTIANLPSLFAGITLNQIKGKFKHTPAVCVAAGPSLDGELEQLKRIGNQAAIIAVDSAVSSLVSAGILPHMVVTVDVRAANYAKLRPFMDQLRDSILVFAVESNPDNVRAFPSPRRIAISSGNPILSQWLSKIWDINCELPGMTTVSYAAVAIAMVLAADPIVFIGMDFSFPAHRSHASNALHRYDLSDDSMFAVEGTDGLAVRSYGALTDYRLQLENMISNRRARTINTSKHGALIKGTEMRSLAEVIENEFDPNCNVRQVFDALDWSSRITHPEILKEFERMIKKALEFKRAARQGKRIAMQAIRTLNHTNIPINRLKTFQNASQHFEEFKKQQTFFLSFLEGYRLESIQDIGRRQEILSIRAGAKDGGEQDIEQLDIIKDYFQSHDEVVRFFVEHLVCVDDYLYTAHLCDIETRKQPRNLQHILNFARVHATYKQFWLAEKDFLHYLGLAPNDLAVYKELTNYYHQFKLWHPAVKILKIACSRFPEDLELQDHFNGIQRNIGDRFVQILQEAQKLWRQVTSAFIEFRAAGLDEQERYQWIKNINIQEALWTDGSSPKGGPALTSDQRTLLMAKANHWANLGEVERSIGIFEGLVEQIPDQAAYLSEKIGDFRYLQHDFKSAAWHYQRAARLDPDNEAVLKKIEQSTKTPSMLNENTSDLRNGDTSNASY